jgi:voltage-dependent calcium channel T type alpha-1G
MTKCSEIPKLRKGNMTCELDLDTYNDQIARNPKKPVNGCIDWNQYYKFCNISDKNPFAGSISFDNIGLAWVVIFQVRSNLIFTLFLFFLFLLHR